MFIFHWPTWKQNAFHTRKTILLQVVKTLIWCKLFRLLSAGAAHKMVNTKTDVDMLTILTRDVAQQSD